MDSLIDVRDLALQLDVSRQTVYNHMQKNEQELLGYTKKIERTTYLTPEAVKIIKESLGLIHVPTVREQVSIEDIIEEMTDNIRDNIHDDIALLLEEQEKRNEHLEEELAETKEQNQELIGKVDELLAEQKKSLWQKLRGK